MSKQAHYIYLIYQQLQGSLTASEEQELNTWLSESTDNQTIKSQVLQSVELMEDYNPDFPIDIEADYAKVRKQMNVPMAKAIGERDAKVVGLPSLKKWLTIAASVALVITAGVFMWNNKNTDSEWMALETSKDEIKNIELADGSTIWLNENSRLSYPSVFSGNDRSVRLEGEAFFDITKDPSKTFKITTDESTVAVLGTSFNVRAYSNEPATTVHVKTGRVQFTSINSSDKVILTKDMEASLDHPSKSLSTHKIADINATAWQTNTLVFKNTPLTDIFKTLEKHFEVSISVENPQLSKCRFSQSPKEVNLKDLFEALKQSYQIEITETGKNKYTVKGKENC